VYAVLGKVRLEVVLAYFELLRRLLCGAAEDKREKSVEVITFMVLIAPRILCSHFIQRR
jgi:hypothetical protein